MAKRKKSGGWFKFIPIILGILATPVALRAAGYLALSGSGPLTALFPWTELLRSPLLEVSAALSDSVGQYLMYLQFPLYGLLMYWIMRKRAFGVAFLVVLFLHFGCVIAVSGLGGLRGVHLG